MAKDDEEALRRQAEQARKDQEARDQVERLKSYDKYRHSLNREKGR